MIYGCIGLETDGYTSDIMNFRLKNAISWDGCAIHEFKWKEFAGTILQDKRLPFAAENFFYIDEGNEILVFLDGFIYNSDDLAFTGSGRNQPESVPGLLCSAYREVGDKFIESLNGDFAIIIYDRLKNRKLFYRDHLGIRPLAVSDTGSSIYFSTDSLGLSKALLNEKKADQDYMLNIFLEEGQNYLLLPNTDVKQVAPGHYMVCNDNGLAQKKYWYPEDIKTNRRITLSQACIDLENLTTDAVRIRSDKKLKASAHISGGLDSGVVAAIARGEYKHQKEFFGFSWTPDLSSDAVINHDERDLVRSICLRHNIEPVYSNFTVQDYYEFASNWRYSRELVFEKKVIETTRNNGVQLIFSGWGGDEFISEGGRGIDRDLVCGMNWACFLGKYPLKNPRRLLSALLFNVLFPSARRDYLKFKTDPSVAKYIMPLRGNNKIPRDKRFKYNSRRGVHIQLLRKYHLSARCEDWYIHGQLNGVEYRYPLLDRRIVEYMLQVPSKCLAGEGRNRIIMRHIARELLPGQVLNHTSKDDEVKSWFLNKTVNEATGKLIDEVKEFKNNPDLYFIDFKLLDGVINDTGKLHKHESEIQSLLFYLKRAHEFTKGNFS